MLKTSQSKLIRAQISQKNSFENKVIVFDSESDPLHRYGFHARV